MHCMYPVVQFEYFTKGMRSFLNLKKMYMKGIFLNICMLLKLGIYIKFLFYKKEKLMIHMLNYFNRFKYTRFNKFILFCVDNNTLIFINGSITCSKFE